MTDRLLDIDEVMERTGLSRTTLYRMVKRGEFPASRKIGRRRMGWVESEVSEWIRELPISEAAK